MTRFDGVADSIVSAEFFRFSRPALPATFKFMMLSSEVFFLKTAAFPFNLLAKSALSSVLLALAFQLKTDSSSLKTGVAGAEREKLGANRAPSFIRFISPVERQRLRK